MGLLLTNKEKDKAGNIDKGWGIVLDVDALLKAQLRKTHHKIESMVADGFYLAEILEAIAKEIEE